MSEPGTNSNPPIPPTTLADRRNWFFYGAVCSTLVFLLIMVAFFSDAMSCDRWLILKYVLPVFTGIAAGAFVGAINVNGTVNGFAVTAVGGFAVWGISLWLIDQPRCKVVEISNVTQFENIDNVGEPGEQMPVRLTVKTSVYRLPTDPNKFVMYVGAAIGNIYFDWQRKTNVYVEIAGLKKDGSDAWLEKDNLVKLDQLDGSGFGNRFPAAEVERLMGLSGAGREGKLLFVWAIECRTATELSDWTGEVRIRAVDLQSRANIDYKKPLPETFRQNQIKVYPQIATPRPQFIATSQPLACHSPT